MKKSIALLIIAILVLPALSFAAPVRASTGAPYLAAFAPTGVGTADGYVTSDTEAVKAGNLYVKSVEGWDLTPDTYMFGLVFTINDTILVDWSGSQFDLYISRDGYSELSEGDKLYATSFNRNALDVPLDPAAPVYKYMNTTTPSAFYMKDDATPFWLGTVTVNGTTYKVLLGAVPYDITNDYKYVKVRDGAGTAVAVTTAIDILAAINLIPTYGPGGAYVCLTGVALAANQMYNISYDCDVEAAAQVTTGDNGQFEFCWNMKDLCEVYDGGTSQNISICVTETGGDFVDSVIFTEMFRVFLEITDEDYGGSSGLIGNNTGSYNVHIFNDFTVAGNWFNPTGPVVITVEGIELASVTPNATGYFEVTFTIPILAQDNHTVKVSNVGCNLFFEIWVNPTLVVIPEVGPIGTEVTFEAYGFPANIPVYLYWWVGQTCDYDYCYLWVANTTTGSGGTFNVTTTWVIPKMPGGEHYITALDTFYFENQTCEINWDDEIAWTYFYVTPTLWVTPSSFSNDGTTFWVNGSGFDPLLAYVIDIDNQAYSVPSAGYFANDYWSWWFGYGSEYPFPMQTWVYNPASQFVLSDLCGDISLQLVKAGFRPGLHVVSLTASAYNDYWMYFDWNGYISDGWWMYPEEHLYAGAPANGNDEGVTWNLGYYPTDVYGLFTVTTEGDLVVGDITANTTAALADLNAKIVAIEDDIATLMTDVGTLKVSVSSLDAKVVALQGSVATVQTTLGTMTGTLTSVAGDMATVKTQVGTINANVASVKSFLPVDMMPVWIAVIFAIIAAIASIYGVLVIRSKIAQ